MQAITHFESTWYTMVICKNAHLNQLGMKYLLHMVYSSRSEKLQKINIAATLTNVVSIFPGLPMLTISIIWSSCWPEMSVKNLLKAYLCDHSVQIC